MKNIKKIMAIILCLLISFSNSIIVYANDSSTDTINFICAEYTRNRTISGVPCVLKIKLNSIDFSKSEFTGLFSVSGGYTYSQSISGNVSSSLNWNSASDGYSYRFSFYVNWKNGNSNSNAYYDLELNDSRGILRGYTDSESGIASLLGGCQFTGRGTTIGALEVAQKISNIEVNEELYNECLQLSTEIYDTNNSSSADIPEKLQKILDEYEYKDIVGNNFYDDKDDNISYSISHKQIGDNKNRCIVVLRGTDGIEWVGNMKICPPDDLGNYDTYTFKNGDDTHHNFLSAATELNEAISNYLDYFNINNENAEVVVTGHSRGGAVANLSAKYLTDDSNFKPQVIAYTFAAPNVAPISKYDYMENYPNIYNFCKNKDFIPCIPLTNHSWDYWKYGTTYIERSSDDNVYCNKITDIMASKDYAPLLVNYYNRYFSKNSSDDSINLYQYMNDVLAVPMSERKQFKVFFEAKLVGIGYRGLSKLSTKLANNLLNIRNNHKAEKYEKLSFDDYDIFTYNDALSRCNVGGIDNIDTLSLMLLSYDEDQDECNTSLFNAVEKSRLMQFASQTDSNNITNGDKLGWDFDDITTLTGIELDENGNVIAIDLHFKNLYGSLNLDGFTSLISVDISANYITGINVSGCTSLLKLNVSDNDLTTLDTTTLADLEVLNCCSNSLTSFNLNNNTNLVELECSSCLLNNLDLSSLADLRTLNCSYNQLSSLDISHNTNLTELYCMVNYLDLTDNNLLSMFSTVENRVNSEVVYEPQYLPKNATFNTEEINSLILFAQYGNNNEILNFIDSDNEIDIDAVQSYVQFKKINGIYRVSLLDFSNENLSGALNCSAFTNLEELYCSNTLISEVNLSNCLQLKKLHCEKASIGNLILPSDASTNSSLLCELSCENNYIDINIFTPEIISQIEAKTDYVLSYRHQNISAPASSFD